MKNLFVFLPTIVLSLLGCSIGDDHRITARELKGHVSYLASDELAGRDPGSPGIEFAENYIGAQFDRYGLKPAPGDTDRFIQFDVYRHGYDEKTTRLTFFPGPSAGATTNATLGVDFRPFWFSDEGKAEAPVVFAGYGITAPEHKWDDYADLDVHGKYVLVLRHEPGNDDAQSPFDGTDYSRHAYFITKARNAQKHGAVGMILFTDPLFGAAGADDLRVGRSLSLDADAGSGRRETIPILAVHITRDLAAQVLKPTGYDLEGLQRAIDGGLSPAEIDLAGLTATIEVGGSETGQRVAARDVAGFLPGRDPELSREIIVIGGHHDHLGSIPDQSGDTVFNGADDNASGAAGVLELAELFSARAIPPRRSLLFLTFSAEEAGLLGSEVLFDQDLIPGDDVVFMINLDMIGRNAETPVSIYGAGFGLDLKDTVRELAGPLGLEYQYRGIGEIPANSDYGSFFDQEIPFLSLFTGTHQDYHQLTDSADRIQYDRMATLLRFTASFVNRLDGLEEILKR